MSKSQKYVGRNITYEHQQSVFATTNGAFYLSKLNWFVEGKRFNTIDEAKEYIKGNLNHDLTP